MSDLDALVNMNYPGRVIIIGKNSSGMQYAAYAITGRSASSQARKMEMAQCMKVQVKPTNEDELKKGNPDLLIYSAIILNEDSIIVSNGKQTDMISVEPYGRRNPPYILESALEPWTFEPDEPHFTPRISAYVKTGFEQSAMSVIKRDRNGNRMRCFYEVETPPGTGRMIATYDGANQNPLPAFEGEPIGVSLQFATAKEISEFVYDALNKDFRVSVATVLSNGEHHIINRNK